MRSHLCGIPEGATVGVKTRDGKTLRYLKSLEETSVIGGNDQGERRKCYEMMLEIKQIDLSIYPPIYLSIKINLWQDEKSHLQTSHTGLSLSVNTSQILTMKVVNRNNQYIDEKDRLFSNHCNKAGMKKVICEAKPIKSAFTLILQQFQSDFFFFWMAELAKC